MTALEIYGPTGDELVHDGPGHSSAIYGITGVLVHHDGATYRQWLLPGLRYEVRPGGGWKLVDEDGVLIGHLVREDGQPIEQLPTASGPLVLLASNSYSLRERLDGKWEVLALEPAI